ncbi:uncharacterized protein LOC129809739 [Phlebotomus papatasi]|uniref:uncharacterized protein LOC129809739 n=1 Tax=Phlebotomus papatasi TaxID=29031 RepID=UPI00248371C7|nr:uncharacterized protein LOC129809739 [Phlebotomus papatasi]
MKVESWTCTERSSPDDRYLKGCPESLIGHLLTGNNVEKIGDQNITNETIVKRYRRYLGFISGGKVFFRVNIKDNVIKVNQIWAHAYGFRQNYDINWPYPSSYKVRRRDVHETVEDFMGALGFNGRACLRRSVCEAKEIENQESGMFRKLFKKIFSVDLRQHSYMIPTSCEEMRESCPINFLDLSPYTDL